MIRLTGIGVIAMLTFLTMTVQAKAQTLSHKQAGIVTIAAFTATGDVAKLNVALNEGLDAGLTINEIKEVLVQMYAYAGFPRSLNAINTFADVVKQREQQGKKDLIGKAPTPIPADKSRLELGGEIRTQITRSTAVADYAVFVPVIDEFLRAHLFGDIFGRDNLDFQSREIATISALTALEHVDAQLRGHFNVGLNVGLSNDQLRNIVSVIETRVDKKQADNASTVLDSVLRNRTERPPSATASAGRAPPPLPTIRIVRDGETKTESAPAENFTGAAKVQRLFQPTEPARASGGLVTFEPGARTNWHIHPLGQTLIVTAGTGWIQQFGERVQEIRVGDVVQIPGGVKHWHGATDKTSLTHIAIQEQSDGKTVEWLEKVSDQQYRAGKSDNIS
jgi:quercetin dioxygenase-like cupin family protein/alkylhydroperoxidase/carboxymuconolactone decarboxylase family protein YurZ